MTHILVNPDYRPNYHRRSRTVDDDLFSKRKARQLLTSSEFDRIRSESRLAWLADWEDPGKLYPQKVDQFATTYSSQHNFKILDRPTKSRPTSPTRRNNPHPTKVFLHLRVLKDKGYPAPRLKPGQNSYAGMYGQEPKSSRVPHGTMYFTLKDIKHLERTGQTEMLKKVMNIPPEESNETWLNTPTRDEGLLHRLPRSKGQSNILSKTVENTFKPEIVPSLHRWLRQAGKEEKEATTNLLTSLAANSSKNWKYKTADPNRYVLRRYETTPKVTIHRPYRTDFDIHPEFKQLDDF